MANILLEDNCPCGLKASFKECCHPYLEKNQKADTAETLMRSRYSAFVTANAEYIYETHDPATRDQVNIDDIKKWSEESVWEGLEILKTEKGNSEDQAGIVDFIAKYSVNGKKTNHHEISTFTFKEGKWYFTDGKIIQESFRRESPKIGRNDPCLCGSNKKYKKCCGR